MRRLLQMGLVAIFALVTIGVLAQPASAHGASGATASNYRTTIDAVVPAQSELSISVKEHGDRLQIINHSRSELIIYGYQNEPYLKVEGKGGSVYENRLSPSLYSNADRYGTTPVPEFADDAAPPEWKKVSSNNNVVVWHDHRAHWMSTTDPPVVQGDRSKSHMLIPDWSVPISLNGNTATINGTVEWIPPQAKWRWLIVAAVVGLLVAMIAALRSVTSAIATGIVVLVLADMVHVAGVFIGGAGQLQTRLGSAVTTDAASVLVWCTGVWVLYAVRRKQQEVVGYAGFFTAAVILVFGGLTDLSTLWNSQVRFGLPEVVARASVATTLGSGCATLALCASSLYGGIARARRGEVRDDHDGASADHQDAGRGDNASV